MWLLLPESTKKDLQEARADLNDAGRFWLWSLLFTVWAIIWGTWWPFIVSTAAAIFVYYFWALDAAIAYGELIKASFDLHRQLLYQSLRWNLPSEPDEERRVGKQITEYLWRGEIIS